MSRVSETGRRPAPTSTSAFGVGKRESHDASAFYARFTAPEISDDSTINCVDLADPFILGDAGHMAALPDNCVALVVTSPPYFVGKEYEADIDRHEVPTSYGEYLQMLANVFAECKRVLEPGGRIAVNVANLGRKPYRSLSADVIRILQDDLQLLLRGEVIWQKSQGASGSCAWGTFGRAGNPTLRDLTERVIIASKGRFDRAVSERDRAERELPSENTTSNDEFMAATLDVWEIPSESARRVGHPAPFPVELPERLVHLYTYRDDLVLDPFLGSGSTAVAAARTGRRYVGYDLDPHYLAIARARVAAVETRRLVEPAGAERAADDDPSGDVVLAPPPAEPSDDFQARASQEGKAAQGIAERVLTDAGFTIVKRNARIAHLGLTINFTAVDAEGGSWNFDVSGAFTTIRGGLLRTDTVWKSLGRAHVLALNGYGPVPSRRDNDTEPDPADEHGPVVFLTSHLPKPRSDGDKALRRAGLAAFFDAIEMLSDAGQERLRRYAQGGHRSEPLAGFWTDDDIASFRAQAGTSPDGGR
jgi:site-specific DNA-methyltransferase (adenine-specific)